MSLEKKKIERCANAILKVCANVNNTILSLVKENGNVIHQISCGKCGFHNCKKSTPHASQTVYREMIKVLGEYGVQNLNIHVKGKGGIGADMISLLQNVNLSIGKISVYYPIKFGGTRGCSPRRT